jgi:hypothetical protein
MDFSATLTVAEIEAVSDYDNRALRDAGQMFERATAASENKNESAFEKSLRIKNTLDVFEETSQTAPSCHVLAVLMNCEYQLWRLNAATPLKHNPFLSHWVEVIQRLDRPSWQEEGTSAALDTLSVGQIITARVLWIKLLLQRQGLEPWLQNTPFEVGRSLLRNGLHEPFDLQPYIRMLEDEGIYEKTPEPEAAAALSSAQPKIENLNDHRPINVRSTGHSFGNSTEKQKEDILHNLKNQPDTAIFEITRLPITLTYLDFLTTILTDRILENHSIDPAPVVTQYIQHALRTIERMDKPPSPSSEVNAEWSANVSEERDMLEYGKEAQSRHILLLLLFIKSLIRKGLIELDVLFYEIAEITVRYVWIKEVREFRTWAEEGIEEDGSG